MEDKVVIEVAEKLRNLADTSTQDGDWGKRSIYKVAASATALNKAAYSPQIVSFGPYHHGRDHLEPMEEHKQRALHYFLKRTCKPLQSLVRSLIKELQVLRECYDQLDKSWEEDATRFLQLMILDGCFMLESLYLNAHPLSDYADNDPVFSNHGKLYIMPYVRRDMLMLENQLPMLVLYKLVAVQNNGKEDLESVNKLILNFCSPNMPEANQGRCLHVLDLYRKSLLTEPEWRYHRIKTHASRYKDVDDIIRSATELNEAGISFRKSKSKSLKDISFRHGVLRLPVIIVDDATEATLLNLMSLERLHVGLGNEVTSYVFFMDNIIDNERDVALLHSKGIIQNAIGSDKAVAKMFNTLSKDITLDPDGRLGVIHRHINAYCKKRWNEWRANLVHTYFRNPWAILTLIAALILFALTIAQTVYTILPYYEPTSAPPSPPPPVGQPPLPPAPAPAPSAPPTLPPRRFPRPRQPLYH
ncbi:hypothetical protein Tsubulata_000211 [Turnera subulata]|uniref:Uncharacterized protein n=1 Tax=Turnera subulata TaxID=218843 RepID=A0A9Q0FZ00_9ROSI|nr:hypothetical protein Tsubulata_000211 [Turnera subulata]